MNNVNVYSLKSEGKVSLSKNFKVKEFKCKDGSDLVLISDGLVKLLQEVREHYNKPVTINSAYRTLSYNAKIGGVPDSQHCRGVAADIVVRGVAPKDVYAYVETLMPNSGGIGLYNTFVHVDVRSTKSRWKG